MTAQPGALALPNTTAGTSFSLQVSSVDDLQRLAKLFAASGLFGRANPNNADAFMAECAIKMLAGLEAGFSPFAAATGVTVINGKPGFSANLLAQAIKRHPYYDYRVIEKTAECCRIRFLFRGEELGVEQFTAEMAKRAGLTKDGGMYSKYPEAMLFARALTAGMRTHCPDALGGAPAYTPEELGAQGQIDEHGMVTVAEVRPPMLSATEDLSAAAFAACVQRGLTPGGMTVLIDEISNGSTTMLEELPRHLLARLAKSGVSPETVERCNAAAEALTVVADDEPPASWDADADSAAA